MRELQRGTIFGVEKHAPPITDARKPRLTGGGHVFGRYVHFPMTETGARVALVKRTPDDMEPSQGRVWPEEQFDVGRGAGRQSIQRGPKHPAPTGEGKGDGRNPTTEGAIWVFPGSKGGGIGWGRETLVGSGVQAEPEARNRLGCICRGFAGSPKKTPLGCMWGHPQVELRALVCRLVGGIFREGRDGTFFFEFRHSSASVFFVEHDLSGKNRFPFLRENHC